MPTGLKRYYGGHDLHFITCSCYQRRPGLGTAARRTLFLKILEQVRRAYDFTVVGYVVMPEHIHLLVSEPETGDLSRVMQVLKQRMAREVLGAARREATSGQGALRGDSSLGPSPEHFWQARYYDYNVWSDEKRVEKLRYIHRNPVKRGLVREPEQWLWSKLPVVCWRRVGTGGGQRGWIRETEGETTCSLRWCRLPRLPPFRKKARKDGAPPF